MTVPYVSLVEWGGSATPAHNIYAWYWAIAEGGTPADVNVAELADSLGCSLEAAASHVAKAEAIFQSSRLSNVRTGAFQRYLAQTKKALLEQVKKLGLRVNYGPANGFCTKTELTEALVNHYHPKKKEAA